MPDSEQSQRMLTGSAYNIGKEGRKGPLVASFLVNTTAPSGGYFKKQMENNGTASAFYFSLHFPAKALHTQELMIDRKRCDAN